MLRGWGFAFVFFGALWSIYGFYSMASDIQLGIAIAGINMFGIGILMVGVDAKIEKKSKNSN